MHCRWPCRAEAKQDARRKYDGPNKRRKWEYQCETCKCWFPDKEVEVHHRVPCGTLTCPGDLSDFVTKLFCEKDGYKVCCKPCHKKEHEDEP